ncbi:hypothetical protein [Trichocoleus sp. FACHB-90]|nr:hypothetical protein [Trichocoleus sp. FACHB-90]
MVEIQNFYANASGNASGFEKYALLMPMIASIIALMRRQNEVMN